MMRMLVALVLALPLAPPARAADGPIRRFAVVAGASLGGPERVPLRYATSDAREVSRVLRRLGGVALSDLTLLEEPDEDRLRSTLATVSAEAARARSGGGRVEMFVYYSGHSDAEGLLLGSARLPYAELRRMLDDVPAEVRVAILDSCASGAFTRAKGGVHRPPFLLDESSRVKGHAFLTSSAAHEAAQESDRLRASFFTHALLTGLRGAADASGDGLVTLNEAYQFAFRETLAGTEATQGGPQHATYDIGLVGSGDVVMTDLRKADALLVLPESLDGRVFVRNSAGHLVAELRKARGARIDLALEEGRYEVRVAHDRRVLAGAFQLASSARTVVDEGRLAGAPLEATSMRGTGNDAAPASSPVQVAYSMRIRGGPLVRLAGSPIYAGEGFKHRRALLGYAAELAGEAWFGGILGVEVAGGYQRIAGRSVGRLPGDGADHPTGGGSYTVYYKGDADVNDELSTIPATFTVKLGVPAGSFRPYVLAGAGLYFVHVERTPAAAYEWLAPGAERLRDDGVYLAPHFGIGGMVRFGRRTSAVLEARYATGDVDVLQETIGMTSVSITAGVGLAF